MTRREVQSGLRQRDGDVFMASLCRLQRLSSPKWMNHWKPPIDSVFFKSKRALLIDLTPTAVLQNKNSIWYSFFYFMLVSFQLIHRAQSRFMQVYSSVSLSSFWQSSPVSLSSLCIWWMGRYFRTVIHTDEYQAQRRRVEWGGEVLFLPLWGPVVLTQESQDTREHRQGYTWHLDINTENTIL